MEFYEDESLIPDNYRLKEKIEGGFNVYFDGDLEVTEMDNQNRILDLSIDRLDKKRERAANVSSIIVTTTSGNTFDGDEDSQNRMVRAIVVMDDVEVIPWTLADNSVINATKAELQEALRLAGQAQSQLWQIDE